ncbi:hypothetical protein [Halorhodospira halochloris]|nr:hypothetical protein [Halorhodospira halochloris]
MNPSLEASWRHPWRQDLHTGAGNGARKGLEEPRSRHSAIPDNAISTSGS